MQSDATYITDMCHVFAKRTITTWTYESKAMYFHMKSKHKCLKEISILIKTNSSSVYCDSLIIFMSLIYCDILHSRLSAWLKTNPMNKKRNKNQSYHDQDSIPHQKKSETHILTSASGVKATV